MQTHGPNRDLAKSESLDVGYKSILTILPGMSGAHQSLKITALYITEKI